MPRTLPAHSPPVPEPYIIAAILWAVLLGGLGGVLTKIGPWYRNLKKPPWQPPDWLFGPAWTLILGLAAWAAILAWEGAEDDAGRVTVIMLYAVNFICHFLWSPMFFTFRRPDWSLIEVAFLWASVLALCIGVAAIFGARQLADRALFHLGQLCRDTQPVYRPAERSVRGEEERLGPGAVAPPDRHKNQQERREADEVEPASLFGGDVGKGEQYLAETEEPEGDCEGEEQLVTRHAPEFEEEQTRYRKAHYHGTGKKWQKHYRSPSQMNPTSNTTAAVRESAIRGTARS